MSATPHPSVAPHRDQTACLEELAAELYQRNWIAYVAATLPHQSPRLVVQHRENQPVSAHLLAAPDDAAGTWYYWLDTGEPIAAADAPCAAAEAIIDALTSPGDTGRKRPHALRHPRSPRVAAAGDRRSRPAVTAEPRETSQGAR